MGPFRAAALGYQQISAASLAVAVGLTLPVGAQQAQGSSCNLSGRLLTVGGTITGAFAVNQVVVGTGIPPNTYIIGPGSAANTWNLTNLCTTQTGVTVTGYAYVAADYAVIRNVIASSSVSYRDDGTAPTAAIGMPMLITDPPFEYYGNLLQVQFILASGAPVLNVSYYRLAG